MGITRPRPDGGVKNAKKKMGITRPRPDGGVKNVCL